MFVWQWNCRAADEMPVPYYDAYLIPIARSQLEAYREFSKKIAMVYREHGATSITDLILDEDDRGGESFHAEGARENLPETLRDFPIAAGAAPTETVILSWTEWPDKAARDAGLSAALADPRVQPDPADGVIFEGRRLVSGAFEHLATW